MKQWSGGGEVGLAQNAMVTAQQIVEGKLRAQAAAHGAEMVVGSDLKLEIREVPCGWEGCELNDLDVDVSWFATGIRRIPGRKQPTHANVPPLILSMMPLGRRAQGDVIEEEDESEEIKRLAKEAEERAAE
jgi:hypothetical protein